MNTFEDVLNAKGSLVYTNMGKSMLPFIKEGRDILVIKSLNERIKKYDIVLSKRPSGRYLLHRVIYVFDNGETLILSGDNSYKKDYVERSSIIGILSQIIRNKEKINFDSTMHRFIIFIWCKLYFIRKPILKLIYFLFRL